MNGSPDDLDAQLLAHFQQDRRALAHDPFVGRTAHRIRAARQRRLYLRQALQVAGVAALVGGSHWLIVAADLVSKQLDVWFGVGVRWLVTPLGTVIILAGISLVALTVLRWRAFRIG